MISTPHTPKGCDIMRILTYNIQAGIGTRSSRDMIFGLRSHFRDSLRKRKTIDAIAEFISDFDIVCLQEIGLGGQRSGGISQLPRLSEGSGLSHSIVQLNREIGKVSKHGNAILSRYPIKGFLDKKLPGRVPGRGKMICEIEGLIIVNTHLSLAPKAQTEQLSFMASELKDRENIVLCGDLNMGSRAGRLEGFADQCGLDILTTPFTKTHPSWAPKRDLDHILISQSLSAKTVKVHDDIRLSDHLPVSVRMMGQ